MQQCSGDSGEQQCNSAVGRVGSSSASAMWTVESSSATVQLGE